MIHETIIHDHSQSIRDFSYNISNLKERVSVLEVNNEHLESRISMREDEIKAISGLVFEIKQMRIDFNKVAEVVVAHGERLDAIQGKPGTLAIGVILFVAGILVTNLLGLMF